MAINIWVLSKGTSGGIEKPATIGMPILFFALILMGVVLFMPEQAGIGTSPISDGLAFLYTPDLGKLGEAGVWLAAAGQIFFTLSVGMGSLQAYGSYLSTKDDIALNGLVIPATNETVVFMWIFKPDVACTSIHMGADIQIPKFFKFVMTYITPLYLFVLLGGMTTEAIPILFSERSAGGSAPVSDASWPYVAASRSILLLFAVVLAVLVKIAWKRNRCDDRKGFVELASNRAEVRDATVGHLPRAELDLRHRTHELLFWRLLSDEGKKHFDPDGVGPAKPPAPGHAEVKKKKSKSK